MLGWKDALDWFRGKINDRFACKHRGRMGPGDEDIKSIRILNRMVAWTEKGIEYEGDQRHVEIACKEYGLKPGSKSVRVPGSKEKIIEKEEMPLGPGKPGNTAAVLTG